MALPVPDGLERLADRLLPWAAALFVAGALLQAYQAGDVTLVGGGTWESHVAVGHGLSALAVGVVVLAYLGSFESPARRLSWAVLATYYATVGLAVFRVTDGLRPVAALHPVAGFLAFLAGALLLAEAAGGSVRLPGLGAGPGREGT